MTERKQNSTPRGPANPHPLSHLKTELIWEGKYDEYGNRRLVRLGASPLPLQRIETIDEPHDRERAVQLSLFDEDAFHFQARRDDFHNTRVAHAETRLNNAEETWQAMGTWLSCLGGMANAAG